MSLKKTLIEQVAMRALLNGHPPKMPGRTAIHVLTVVSAVAAIAGLLFMALALYHHFETIYSEEKTLILMSGVMLLVSVFAFLFTEFIVYCGRMVMMRTTKNLFHSIGDVYEGVVSDLDAPIKNHLAPAIVLTVLAGIFLGRKIP